MEEENNSEANAPGQDEPPELSAGITISDADIDSEIASLLREAEGGEGKDKKEAQDQQRAEQFELVQSVEEEYSELLAMVLNPGFAVLAPGWGITSGEVGKLAAVYAPVLAKYFPDGTGGFFEAYGKEIAALTITAAIFKSRLGVPRKLPDKSAPESPDESASESGESVDIPLAGNAGGDAQVTEEDFR